MNAIIPDFKVNDIQGSALPPHWNEPCVSITTNDNGSFVITWTDERNGYSDIYAQRYSSDGTALGINFKVNDDVDSVDQKTPSISTDDNGNFVIAWTEWHDRNNDNVNIYAQRYSNNGTPLGSNFKVNNLPDSIWCEHPSVSLDKTGNFVISWDGGWDIYAQIYASDGNTIGSNFRVNDVTQGVQRKSSVSMDPNGNFVIAWSEDSRNGDPDIYTQRYSSDGTVLGSNFKVNDEVGYMWYSYSGPTPLSISSDSSGDFLIAWAENRIFSAPWNADIYAQRYSSTGIILGSNFKVNDDIDSSAQRFSSVSMDNGGNFIITWNDERNNDIDIFAQRYTSDGNKLGNNFLVTNIIDSLQHGPCVKLCNGRIYTVWTDNRTGGDGFDIWANVLDWELVGISDDELNVIPIDFVLHQNYPNPFNPSTTIEFDLPKSEYVTIEVYNTIGQKIVTLIGQPMTGGRHQVVFNGTPHSSGIYYYKMEAGNFRDIKKMILIK